MGILRQPFQFQVIPEAQFRQKPTSYWRRMLLLEHRQRWKIDFKSGADGEAGLAVLLDLMRDPDPEIRWLAVYHFRDIERDSETGVQCLIRALSDSDGTVQLAAAHVLSEFKSHDQIRIALVANLKQHEDCQHQVVLCDCIWKLTGDADLVVPTLQRIVRQRRGESSASALGYACQAADLLAKFGPAARPAIPDIIELIETANEHWNVVYAGSKALACIGVASPDVIGCLRRQLSINDPVARIAEAQSLWVLTKREGVELLQIVVDVVQRPTSRTFAVVEGIEALGSFGPSELKADLILQEIVDDCTGQYREEDKEAAADSLRKIRSFRNEK